MEKYHHYRKSEWDGIHSTAIFGKYILWGIEAVGWAFIPWYWLVIVCVMRLLGKLTLFSWGQFLEKDSAVFLVANIPQGWRNECFSPKEEDRSSYCRVSQCIKSAILGRQEVGHLSLGSFEREREKHYHLPPEREKHYHLSSLHICLSLWMCLFLRGPF